MTQSRMLWAIALIAAAGLLLSARSQLPVTHAMRHSTDSENWVKYSAHYTEKVSTTDTSGNQTEKLTLTEEFRSENGDLLTVVKDHGQQIRGTLWLADGHRFSLNYINKTAMEMEPSPRKHPYVPPDPILGTKTISGVNCAIYPLHGQLENGDGTICVDMQDDILAELEVHSDAEGLHQDLVTTLSWIDLRSPVDPSLFRIPDGFETIVPANT